MIERRKNNKGSRADDHRWCFDLTAASQWRASGLKKTAGSPTADSCKLQEPASKLLPEFKVHGSRFPHILIQGTLPYLLL